MSCCVSNWYYAFFPVSNDETYYYLNCEFISLSLKQGSHGHGKSWKTMENEKIKSRRGKVMENENLAKSHGKVMEF